ncbi:recombinase family protein [Sphingomonas sp. LY29]|uniref:recombinase family protein n=1 Tax=Sphingomonas sp. LY29 TaxID=3095341 RepID=UPI002D78F28A|nr:recombinase family protein [Sphingomonas sp. LY29]WRP25274.1 recombinase family protein [Sphingomonas sp. LY29]
MRVVTYFRVSTVTQGRSGLGLEAQRQSISEFCSGRSCEVLGEYVEIESGRRNDRPKLIQALRHAKVTGATLVVAKLDRLSRNAAFLLALRDSGAKLVAADQPNVNDMTIGILAVVAEAERKAISERTSVALKAAKARGTKLGNPNGAAAIRRAGKGNGAAIHAIRANADRHAADLADVIKDLQAEGRSSLRELAAGLNERRMRTPRGATWHATSVKNLLARVEAAGVSSDSYAGSDKAP